MALQRFDAKVTTAKADETLDSRATAERITKAEVLLAGSNLSKRLASKLTRDAPLARTEQAAKSSEMQGV
jgi:hypothetical protein